MSAFISFTLYGCAHISCMLLLRVDLFEECSVSRQTTQDTAAAVCVCACFCACVCLCLCVCARTCVYVWMCACVCCVWETKQSWFQGLSVCLCDVGLSIIIIALYTVNRSQGKHIRNLPLRQMLLSYPLRILSNNVAISWLMKSLNKRKTSG